MNRKLLLLLFSVNVFFGFSQIISTFPHNEDFESWNTCSTAAGSTCNVPTPWLNESGTDNLDWTTDIGGTGSSGTGPSIDHNPGTSAGKYLYLETSSPATLGQTAHLRSPWFDFTAVLAPRISFWYHMFGASMGTMSLEARTGALAPWTTVVPAMTGNIDQWFESDSDLATYAGEDSVQFRWVGTVGTSFTSDMAIDDVTVYQTQPTDMEVTSIDNLPASACGLGMVQVSTTLTQIGYLGLNIGDTLFISYNDGTNIIEDTVVLTSALGVGATYVHTFSQMCDFSVPGTYNATVTVTTSNDTNAANDVLASAVSSIPLINTLPYSEDFETDNGGWLASGNQGDWEWGVPSASLISSSGGCGGTKAWVTNLTGAYSNNAVEYLTSPCMDFSSLTSDPYISFDLMYNTETNFDDARMEVSLDGGTTWGLLGGFGTGLNWYNNPAGYWEGNSSVIANGWIKAANVMSNTAGQPNVRVRFVLNTDGSVTYEGIGIDNVAINANLNLTNYTDAAINALNGPVSSCGLTPFELVVTTLENNGPADIVGFDVCYTLDGGTPVCETVTATIPANGTYQHTFLTAADLSSVGAHVIDIQVYASGELDTCNNLTSYTVTNKPLISTFPYLEKFDNGNGGWEAVNNASGTWELATPANTVINSAYSPNNSWITNAAGSYNNGDNSYIVSPCFDMTNMQSGSWVGLAVWWNSEFSWDGANLQFSVDNGSTWTTLGNMGTGVNWYTDNTINGNPGGSQLGWSGRNSTGNGSGTWQHASHPLDDSLMNYSSVTFRINFGSDGSVVDDGFAFDNFAIGVPTQVDLGADFVGCANYEIDLGLEGEYNWYTEEIISSTSTFYSNDEVVEFTNTSPTFADTTYNGILVFYDTLGLQGIDTVQLTLSAAPYNVLNDVTACYNDTVTFNVQANPAYTYSWNNGSTIDSAMYIGANIVTVVVTNTITGCYDSTSAEVFANAPVSVPTSVEVCQGDSILIDATLGYTSYSWSNGSTDSSIYVSTAGDYIVTATDNIGCLSYDTATLVVNALPSVSITGATDTLCDYNSLSLNGGSGFVSYAWSTGGTTQTESVAGSSLNTGYNQITLDVVDNNGCMNSDTISVYVDQCLGLDENSLVMMVYPNPSRDVFNYEISNAQGNLRFELYDMYGKVVMTTTPTSEAGTIDLSAYENGTYFLHITNESTATVVRLVKQ